jgi:hypothetical protein
MEERVSYDLILIIFGTGLISGACVYLLENFLGIYEWSINNSFLGPLQM